MEHGLALSRGNQGRLWEEVMFKQRIERGPGTDLGERKENQVGEQQRP